MMMIKNKNLYIFTFSIKFLKIRKEDIFIKKYEFTKKIFL
jgi:hypothetical protein